MESFEDFGVKVVIRFILINTSRFVSRRCQGYCLNFEPGRAII